MYAYYAYYYNIIVADDEMTICISIVSREGLAPIVKAYSRLIPVDGLVL